LQAGLEAILQSADVRGEAGAYAETVEAGRRRTMRLANAVAAIGVLAITMLCTAAHAVNRFGVVCIKNKTEVTIFYRTKLADGAWHERNLQPGWEQTFAHKYATPNAKRSPELDIQFDSDLRAQRRYTVTYKLPRRAAVGDSCDEGAQYQFEYDHGRREFIDLKKAS
jgi:hypothetical protein